MAHNKTKFIADLVRFKGHEPSARKEQGISARTLRTWKEKDPDLLQEIVDFNDELIDDAMLGLKYLVAKKDFRAIKFVLENRQKEYSPKLEVAHTGAVIWNETRSYAGAEPKK